MADKTPEKSTVEEILDTLAVPGSFTREVLVQSLQAMRGDSFNGEEVLDNFTKKQYTSPDEFLTEWEKTTGMDKRMTSSILGAAAGAAFAAPLGPMGMFMGGLAGGIAGGTTDFGANLLTDIATDPIGLAFKPLQAVAKTKKARDLAAASIKAQRRLTKSADLSFELADRMSGKSIQGLAKREAKIMEALTRQGLSKGLNLVANSPEDITRALTGATLGALSYSAEDDNWLEATMKIGGLAMAGPAGIKGLRNAANAANVKMSEVMDGYVIWKNQDLMNQIRQEIGDEAFKELTPSKAAEIARSASRSPEFKKNFANFLEAERGIDAYATSMFTQLGQAKINVGNMKAEELDDFVALNMRSFNNFRKQLFSQQASIREEEFDKSVRMAVEEWSIKNNQMPSVTMPDGSVKPIDLTDLNDPDKVPLKSIIGVLDETTKHKLLNKASERSARDVRLMIEPKLRRAGDFVQKSLIDKITETNQGLMKKYNAANAGKEGFIPITGFDFWTYDVSGAEKVADAFRAAPDSFVKRTSSDMKSVAEKSVEEGLDFYQLKEASDVKAATAYAGMFLSQKERNARRITAQILSAREGSASLGKMYEHLANYRKGKMPLNEMLNKNGEIAMNIYDKWLGLIKSTHLITNATWTKNNMLENTINAYLSVPEAGITSGARAAAEALGSTVPGVHTLLRLANKVGDKTGLEVLQQLGKQRSFNKIFDAVSGLKNADDIVKVLDYNDDMLNLARDFDVIDSNKFTDFKRLALSGDTGYLTFLAGEEGAVKIAEDFTREGIISRMVDKTSGALWDSFIGKYNNVAENTMRYVTWKENLKALGKVKYGDDVNELINSLRNKKGKIKIGDMEVSNSEAQKMLRSSPADFKSPKVRDLLERTQMAMKEASERTKDIFIDYDNVTSFERQVMKRIFPYWTFWSRNFDKFTNLMFDPNFTPKIAKSAKVLTSQGDPISRDERAAIPKFFRQRGVRVKSRDGDIELVSAPGLALLEFAGNLTAKEDTLARLSPIIKAFPGVGAESFMNLDFLTKRQLLPNDKNPTVQIFENAITGLMSDEDLESIGIDRNKFGSLTTTNRAVARALHLQKNLAPFMTGGGVVDEYARAMRNVKFRGSTNPEEIAQFLSPFQKSIVPHEMGEKTRKRIERNYEMLRTDDPEVRKRGAPEARTPVERKIRDVNRKRRRLLDQRLRKAQEARRKARAKINSVINRNLREIDRRRNQR
jgi:hypothetical protein